jgi:hypothetical protein
LPVPLPGLPVALSSVIPLIPPNALPLLPATGLDTGCQGAAGGALPNAAPSPPSTTGAPPPPAHAATPTPASGRVARIP